MGCSTPRVAARKKIVAVDLTANQDEKKMQLLSICTKKEYEKDGEQKVNWYKIGVLKIADSGKKYIRLFHQPQTEYFVFEPEQQSPETAA